MRGGLLAFGSDLAGEQSGEIIELFAGQPSTTGLHVNQEQFGQLVTLASSRQG